MISHVPTQLLIKHILLLMRNHKLGFIHPIKYRVYESCPTFFYVTRIKRFNIFQSMGQLFFLTNGEIKKIFSTFSKMFHSKIWVYQHENSLRSIQKKQLSIQIYLKNSRALNVKFELDSINIWAELEWFCNESNYLVNFRI